MQISSEIIETIHNFITRENITLALAILGSFGTLSSWFFVLLKNRKNLKMHIVGHRFSEDNHSLLIYTMFENKSRLPISITGIYVEIGNVLYSCEKIPIVTFEETVRNRNQIISRREYRSMTLPISIPELGGTSGYVYFEFPATSEQLPSTHLNFQLSTNRGKIVQNSLSLDRFLD